MKKNNPLLSLLFIASASTAFGMEPEQPKKNWLALAIDSLLYDIKPLERSFLQASRSEDLPLEEQSEVIFFLNQNYIASNLNSAANAINSLTKVNKQLDTLINNPNICLKLIQHLADRFDCSDETAVKALQTKEANERLVIQKKFEILFSQPSSFAPIIDETKFTLRDFIKKFKELYDQYKDYVDLNFTYRDFQDPQHDYKDTLLINSAIYSSPYKIDKIRSLLETHTVNINYQNAFKETALMKCAVNCENPAALKLLCDDPNIQIDLQDENGNTALMKVCLMKVSAQKEVREKSHKAICIALLLRAGADPEKMNIYEKTPLTLLKSMGDNEKEIKLIEDAILKKRSAELLKTTQQKKSTATKKRPDKK